MNRNEIIKLIIGVVIGLLSFTASIAGAIYFLGEQYAPKAPTETRLAGLELQSLLYQLEQINRRLVDLQVQRPRVPLEVKRIIDKEILRLKREREKIQRQIDFTVKRR